jgi:hypothetical protein
VRSATHLDDLSARSRERWSTENPSHDAAVYYLYYLYYPYVEMERRERQRGAEVQGASWGPAMGKW